MKTRIWNASRRVGAGALLATAFAMPVPGQVTSRVSVGTNGAQGNDYSLNVSVSDDGRYVAFFSRASNLVSGDTNGSTDVFVRDRQSGTTERVSVDSSEVQGNGDSRGPFLSPDGRYVAFWSYATNLVGGDTNGSTDVFVRERIAGTTERVSLGSGGAQANDHSDSPKLSADGRYVAFVSGATNLFGIDTNAWADVFVRDRQSGTTQRVSVDSGGAQGNGYSISPSISADGRYVAFYSLATNLVAADTNGSADVFVHDRQSDVTERVSVDSGEVQGNSASDGPSISGDGRFVAYYSFADNLVGGDTNADPDIFLRDRQAGTTERVSVDSGGAQGNDSSWWSVSISADSSFVAFRSFASNLVGGDTNATFDIFLRDRQAGTTERVSVDSGGEQGNNSSNEIAITGDGRFVAFTSYASNLVWMDTNGQHDVFVHDRLGGPDFTSLCDPGLAGVIACPCSNPPGGPGSGCDNSSGTGGAVLSASGGTYLSSDSLMFTTSGEKPTALSIVLQGNAPIASGAVYGQGVRCAGGALKRLFSKSASGGSITAPDFGMGDPTVSAQSAAKGDPISAGQSRWYLVYYRDPIVLGGCPATSTFNATQTGRVAWSL